jgi:hypothetical protein
MHGYYHAGNYVFAALEILFIIGSYQTAIPFQLNPAWAISGIPLVVFWPIIWIIYVVFLPPVLHKMER